MLVSIIILYWNDGIENCNAAIHSAQMQDYLYKEIIFVDNGSQDGVINIVRQKYPDLLIVETGENLGCPGGRNAGAVAAKGDLVFFLETDGVWASNDVVSGAVKLFSDNQTIGALYTRVEGYLTNSVDSPVDHTITADVENGIYLSSSFRGGASVLRRDLFNLIGMFPADFFRQYEERYVSLYIYELGYDVVYWPEKVLRHKGSDYPGKSDTVVKYNCINELKTILRIYPHVVFIPFFIVKTFLWSFRLLSKRHFLVFKQCFFELLREINVNNKHSRINLKTVIKVNRIRYGRINIASYN